MVVDIEVEGRRGVRVVKVVRVREAGAKDDTKADGEFIFRVGVGEKMGVSCNLFERG